MTYLKKIPIEVARSIFDQLVEEVAQNDVQIMITKNGKDAVVLAKENRLKFHSDEDSAERSRAALEKLRAAIDRDIDAQAKAMNVWFGKKKKEH